MFRFYSFEEWWTGLIAMLSVCWHRYSWEVWRIMAAMPDPQSVKQVVDCLGYSVMGLVGAFGAWQRMRVAAVSGPAGSMPSHKGREKSFATERLGRVEQDIVMLRTRQDEMHQECVAQQSVFVKQQTAMFDLLVQQRSSVDKILNKMSGLV